MKKRHNELIKSSTLYLIATFLITATFIFTGCSGGGASGVTAGVPSALTYSTTSAVYTKDLQIADNIPEYTRNADSWSVEPALPDGLEIDSTTGVISGKPVTEQQAKEYTITASNSSGMTTAVVSVTINNQPPTALTYSATSAVYTKDMPITENIPTVTGTVALWTVSPALPDGLYLDPATGVISGEPVREQDSVYYTVTASNSGGSATTDILIVINSKAPSSLSYSNAAAVYTKDLAILENTPSVSGTVASWSVIPDLPEGLTLNTETGVISGIPSEIQDEKSYTVTATNSGGSTTGVITIAINDRAPSDLSYVSVSTVYTVGEVISGNIPSVTGTITSWSVTPALPDGLTLNTTTGVISGTPSEEQSEKTYTITASNSGGSVSAQISITVNYSAPSDLSYSSQAAVYTKGVTVTGNKPTVNGTVASWSVTPALPKGLIMNTTTGVITGTPELIQGKVNYTITAANSGGSISTIISIKVNDLPPSGLVYSPSTARLGRKIKPSFISHWIYLPTSISLVPQYTGTVTSWSIDKALPSGVSLNTSTGFISGTGQAAKGSSTSYTVTASNSGGSVSTVIIITGP